MKYIKGDFVRPMKVSSFMELSKFSLYICFIDDSDPEVGDRYYCEITEYPKGYTEKDNPGMPMTGALKKFGKFKKRYWTFYDKELAFDFERMIEYYKPDLTSYGGKTRFMDMLHSPDKTQVAFAQDVVTNQLFKR